MIKVIIFAILLALLLLDVDHLRSGDCKHVNAAKAFFWFDFGVLVCLLLTEVFGG